MSLQLFHWSMVSNEVVWWHVPKRLLFACSRQFATAQHKLQPLCPAAYRIDHNQSASKSTIHKYTRIHVIDGPNNFRCKSKKTTTTTKTNPNFKFPIFSLWAKTSKFKFYWYFYSILWLRLFYRAKSNSDDVLNDRVANCLLYLLLNVLFNNRALHCLICKFLWSTVYKSPAYSCCKCF